MSVVEEPPLGESPLEEEYPHAANVGPIGRIGRYTATHFRVVLVGWLVVAIGLGFFAPRVETALSGAGWETTGSQSVQARQLIDKNFRGLSSYGLMTVIYSPSRTINDPAFKGTVAKVEAALRADNAVRSVVPPTPGVSISRDGHTAIVQAGAARSSNGMVKAADSLKTKLAALSSGGVQVHLTGAVGDVVGLQRRQPHGDDEVRGDLLAGHARDPAARVRVAGRRRAAADADDDRARFRGRDALPGDAGHADLDLGDELRADVRARAGDRLRAVRRAPLPGRVLRPRAVRDRRDRGDDGHRRQGRPVLGDHRADLADRGDARALAGVPLDEPRDHARRDLRARRDAHAAARRAREARPEGGQARAPVGALRRAPLAAIRAMGRAAVAPADPLRHRRAGDPGRTRAARHPAEDGDAIDQGRPDLRRLARRLQPGPGRVRPGRGRARCRSSPRQRRRAPPRKSPAATPGSRR